MRGVIKYFGASILYKIVCYFKLYHISQCLKPGRVCVLKRGDVKKTLMDDNEKYVSVFFQKNTLYIPSYPQYIFSVQVATGRGASVIFEPASARLTYRDGTNIDIAKRDILYFLDTYTDCQIDSDTVNYTCDVQRWHEILGHWWYFTIRK